VGKTKRDRERSESIGEQVGQESVGRVQAVPGLRNRSVPEGFA
jgi:hypothetical protein